MNNKMLLKTYIRALQLGLPVILLLAAAFFAVSPAQAAGTVTNCTTYDGGPGSLKQALAGGGTVTFACSGTIIVPEISITANALVVIDATGQNVTLSGNHANRVFNVKQGKELTLRNITIANGKTSEDGGGIKVEREGALSLNNVVVRDNVADFSGGGLAFFSRNELRIINTTFLRNTANDRFLGGGAIYYVPWGISTVPLNIQGSTFSENKATGTNIARGGAIFLATEFELNGSILNVNITNTTFSANSALRGGAIGLDAGVNKTFGTPNTINLKLSNSTFAGNQDLGGNPDDLHAEQEVTGSETNVQFDNTIITGGCESTGDQAVPFVSQGYNISKDATCNFTQPTDHQNTDPLLDSLKDNGGPTLTHALLPGSPAINAGDTALTTDQRGIARPQVAADDIGAFESRGFSLAYSAGSPQSTLINTPFTDPLVVTVSSAFAEPVDGGQVIFTAPGNGASLATTPLTAAISSGSASQAVSANGETGSYTVSAQSRGNLGSPVSFDLTNLTVSCSASSWSVDSEAELSDAIFCYNGKAAAGKYTINVTQDIDLTASTTVIDNATSGVELIIEGGGHTVDGQNTSGVRPFTIEDDTTVTLKTMTITGGNTQDGGGISNSGTLTILNSTISYNQGTRFGGGIDNGGALYVVNSTVSHNVASNQTNEGSGGGIYNVGTLTVVNSTISDNEAFDSGGGILNTFSGNLALHNSIVANNTGSGPTPDCQTIGTATAQNSLVETGTPGFGCLSGSNNLSGDPNLGPLQNNGGPTETHALLPASIAVNAGDDALAVDPDNNPLPTDQRGPGFPRINGGTVDMGAYEFGCPTFPVGVATEGQLNFAIACYNAQTVAGSYTIIIAADIDLTASTTTIDNATSGVALVIEGSGYTVDGQGTSGVRPFTIEDDTTVTLKTMTITGGNSQDGGGISNSGTLTILNSTISYNQGTRFGGGIDNGGTLTVVNSTISHNEGHSGGGIYNSGTVTFVNSTISDNASSDVGGIQNTFRGTLTLHNTIVANNTGGQFPDCVGFGTVTTQHSLVETGTFGAVGCLNGPYSISGDPNLGPLQDNGGPTETHALLPGSKVINAGDNALAVDLLGSPLATDQRGAGFPRIIGGTVDMGAYEAACPAFPFSVANVLELNYAIACYNAETVAGKYTISVTHDIFPTSSNPVTVIDNATSGVELVIEGNGHAVNGQGESGQRPFTIEDDTTVTLKNMTVSGGNVTDFGGGILNSGRLGILNSTISYNRSEKSGGGISNVGELFVINSTVSHNVSSDQVNTGDGGGIENGETLTVVNSTISDNEAFGSGSGILNTLSGKLTLHNSIVANNTGFGPTPDCQTIGTTTAQNSLVETGTPGFGCLNGPNNLNGDPNLGPLQNNGGPTETHALLPGSKAINAGDNALILDPDKTQTDQRGAGFPRIIAGTVDMGAYEASCTLPLDVATESELNDAITCYNGKTAAGTYTIALAKDIDLTASTTTIDNANSGVALVIEGNGHAVDGQNTAGVRVFILAENTTVTLRNITVANGNADTEGGGGVYVNPNARLTVENSTFTGNAATEGAAIYAQQRSTVNITSSTIFGNTATSYGGGLLNWGTMSITNSTISGNSSGYGGGGVNVIQGTLTLRNTTMTANHASVRGGGILQKDPAVVTLDNTIVSGNTVGDPGISPDLDGRFSSSDHNLIGNTTGAIFTPAANDIVGQDPLLDTLKNNGGPTWTHALLPGSPAINAGDTALATDQRGLPRPALGADDIGAFELQPQTFALTVTKDGTGSGTVTSSPAGIDCGSTCSANFTAGTQVTLTATADTGSTFTGWTGAGCSGTGTCVVTMDSAKSVTATFDTTPPVEYTLTVTKDGTGSGTVTSSPAGIDCGGTCSANFSAGTVVTLTATADTGSTFTGWTGVGCSGAGTCVVTMDSAKSVQATFNTTTYMLYLPIVRR